MMTDDKFLVWIFFFEMLTVAQPVNKFRDARRSPLWSRRLTTGQEETNDWKKSDHVIFRENGRIVQ